MVSASPSASDSTLTSANNGHDVAVFGRVEAVWVCAWGAADGDEPAAAPLLDAVCDVAADGARVAAAVDAVVACTSFSVMTRGGFVVMMVALNISP